MIFIPGKGTDIASIATTCSRHFKESAEDRSKSAQ
jgi:hypothetical protein